MFNQIKYTYIEKNKSTNGIINNLTETLKELELMIEDYVLIDNVTLGVKLYPDIIQDKVIRCSKENVIKKVKQSIEGNIDLILINGFNINLDEIKEVYAPLMHDTDIFLCINELSDNSSSTYLYTDIKDLSKEE